VGTKQHVPTRLSIDNRYRYNNPASAPATRAYTRATAFFTGTPSIRAIATTQVTFAGSVAPTALYSTTACCFLIAQESLAKEKGA
jgi:hypothetical protein